MLYRFRFVWAIITLTSATIFALLVIDKIQYLESNPKSVNVDVDYNDSLPFPSVTFCNLNPYRFDTELNFFMSRLAYVKCAPSAAALCGSTLRHIADLSNSIDYTL
jgi:Amiloride-sensitive sodium channel